MERIKSVRDFMLDGKKPKEEKKDNYIPLDLEVALGEHGEYVQSGETCRIDALKDLFAWMRGFVSAFYGWSNDGKGTATDYLMLIKSIRDGWKWGLYKQEDMDTIVTDGKVKIKANRIYLNLAWTYTGKTWNRKFAEKHGCEIMTLEELKDALDFISKHFFVIYPDDRRLEFILKDFRAIYDIYGVDGFMLDPWNTVKLDESKRGDHQLVDAFIDVKEFAMLTNSCFNIINHPKSLHEVKDKEGKYKVVNQFLQLGGSAWDIKMDSQYSIYRQERHLDPRSTKTTFFNLKQRQAEIVGVNKGEFSNIEFDFKKRRYYFDNVDVISGEFKDGSQKQASIFSQQTNDSLPF